LCRLHISTHLANCPEHCIFEVQLGAHMLDGKLPPPILFKRRWPSNDNAFVTRDFHKFRSNGYFSQILRFYIKLLSPCVNNFTPK
jgi:hypothetical protein